MKIIKRLNVQTATLRKKFSNAFLLINRCTVLLRNGDQGALGETNEPNRKKERRNKARDQRHNKKQKSHHARNIKILAPKGCK